MKNFVKVFLLVLPLLVIFFQPTAVKAADALCYCELDLDVATSEQIKNTTETVCKVIPLEQCVTTYPATLVSQGKVNFICLPAEDTKECAALKSNWQNNKIAALKNLKQVEADQKKIEAASKSQLIPACALDDKIDFTDKKNPCTDVTIFVTLMLTIVNYLLSFVGGLALLFFIYGGFILIFSSGSPDKITQGKEIIMAAFIGLIVAFCGYVLVSYLGTAVGISSTYALQ